jgi:alpha-L-fucosidase
MNKNYRPRFKYTDFASEFTAKFYDFDKWAEIFKASGAQCIILTSKHREGFTLWPSKYSFNRNSVHLGPKRDLLGVWAIFLHCITQFFSFANKTDLRFGVYYSLME